jgi:predicted enzyme related to lactoylglutathione lyase
MPTMADKLLGSFVWCELMTADTAAAQSFYNKVVGWKSVPFAPDGSYSVFNSPSGAGVAGVMQMPANAAHPPNWMMYVGAPNVDQTALRVAQLGGRVVRQPEDIPNTGRFAVVQDPYGATFGIYQPAPGRPGKCEEPAVGDFSWFELYTPNPEGAWKFYQSLFGWEKTSAMDMGDMGTYQMFGRGGGIPRGGIMKPPPGAPAAWQPYALVKDAKAAAALAASNGGKIVNGPMEVPGGDWIAVGVDPQGAMFAVHSLNPAAGNRGAGTAKPAKKAAVTKKKAAPVQAKGKTRKAKAARAKTARPVKRSAKKRSAPAKKKAAKKKTAKKASKKKAARRKK